MSFEGKTIRIVTGEEPIREGEHPNQYMIGTKVNFWRNPEGVETVVEGQVKRTAGPMETVTVTRIEHRVDNRGDHGIGWYDIFADDVIVASMNERHVAEVCYDLTEQVPEVKAAP